MEADFIRTIEQVAFIVAMTVRHWAGLWRQPARSDIYLVCTFHTVFPAKLPGRICRKTRWNIKMDLVGNSISYLSDVYMLPLSRPIDSGLW